MGAAESIVRHKARLLEGAKECNAGYLEAELGRRRLLGDKPITILRVIYHLKGLYQALGQKDMRELSQRELAEYLETLEARAISDFTIQSIKRTVKTFFSYLISPEFSGFIKPKVLFSELQRKDLLSLEEVMMILEAAETLRDKAMIALVYDGALRPHELVKLKVKDMDLGSRPAHVYIPEDTKTGKAVVPLTFSLGYLESYLKFGLIQHDGWLWHAQNNYKVLKPLGKDGFEVVLKRAAKRAGIVKRVYPYLLRHSRLTELSNVLTEPQLKKFARWQMDSPMIRNYIHLDYTDLDKAITGEYSKDKTLELILAKLEKLEKRIEA